MKSPSHCTAWRASTSTILAAAFLVSCGSRAKSETTAPFGIHETRPDLSGLVVYSDIEGQHVPPRIPAIRPGSHVELSFVACERRSEEYGPAHWSCRPDGSAPTKEEGPAIERLEACFDVERREAAHDIVVALGSDRWQPPPSSSSVQLVFLRLTSINRSKEIRAVGCEGANGRPCDPVGAEATGRTLEQITHTIDVLLIGDGAPAEPYLRAWPFPAWTSNVALMPVDTGDVMFAPAAARLTSAQAKEWLERLSKVDGTGLSRTTRLALLWDRTVLAFRSSDLARGAPLLAAVEKELAPEASREAIDWQILNQTPTLHGLLDHTLSLTDPCRR
jgi:hypothetical protein